MTNETSVKDVSMQFVPPSVTPLRCVRLSVALTDLSGNDSSLGWHHGEEGIFVGHTDNSRKIVAFSLAPINNFYPDLDIEYQAHIQNAGWMDNWVKMPGQISSHIPNDYRQIEAVRIRVAENVKKKYGIAYFGHMHNPDNRGGGTGWIYDGDVCGRTGENRPLGALAVVLYKR